MTLCEINLFIYKSNSNSNSSFSNIEYAYSFMIAYVMYNFEKISVLLPLGVCWIVFTIFFSCLQKFTRYMRHFIQIVLILLHITHIKITKFIFIFDIDS